jgi:hypothetical protein
VIGHGDSWLPKLSRVRYNFFKLVSPIEEAVLGVKMEVNELRHVASKERKKTVIIDPNPIPSEANPQA